MDLLISLFIGAKIPKEQDQGREEGEEEEEEFEAEVEIMIAGAWLVSFHSFGLWSFGDGVFCEPGYGRVGALFRFRDVRVTGYMRSCLAGLSSTEHSQRSWEVFICI